MKHTPGTWILGKIGDTIIVEGTGDSEKDHIQYYGGEVVAESISFDADRHLISAAPEMFEALVEIIKFHNDEIHDLDVWDKAEDAIKKAKGEI